MFSDVSKKVLGFFIIIMVLSMPVFAQEGGTKGDKKEAPVAKENPLEYIRIETSMGNVVVELNREKAPLSVANFLNYVDKNFYDNTIFHRIISNFMIQAGGVTSDMEQKPGGKPIENECKNGLKNARGTIAMGRTNDLNSATTHFYINVKDNFNLDGACYAVFGQVIDGMDIVDKIKMVKTGTKRSFRDAPLEDVIIKTIVRTEKPKK
ncbi:MAG: peptidylprolyl isomerase [candidate division Zixibacteria bacterium]